jgi:hypothetical protein
MDPVGIDHCRQPVSCCRKPDLGRLLQIGITGVK